MSCIVLPATCIGITDPKLPARKLNEGKVLLKASESGARHPVTVRIKHLQRLTVGLNLCDAGGRSMIVYGVVLIRQADGNSALSKPIQHRQRSSARGYLLAHSIDRGAGQDMQSSRCSLGWRHSWIRQELYMNLF